MRSQLSLRLTQDRLSKLRKIADGEGVSLNEAVGRLVDIVPVKVVSRSVELYELNVSGNKNTQSAKVLAGQSAMGVAA